MLAKNARLKQINTNTLWDKAYLSLKSALLAGKYAPGERIILRKVAQDLGISLTPVRDAINRLAAENVLDRGGGWSRRRGISAIIKFLGI
jgi:DNA-binding GntR family transcriptional regulator